MINIITSIPILKQLSGNGFGVAAFECGKMVGFLCSVEPFENAFRSTDVKCHKMFFKINKGTNDK